MGSLNRTFGVLAANMGCCGSFLRDGTTFPGSETEPTEQFHNLTVLFELYSSTLPQVFCLDTAAYS